MDLSLYLLVSEPDPRFARVVGLTDPSRLPLPVFTFGDRLNLSIYLIKADGTYHADSTDDELGRTLTLGIRGSAALAQTSTFTAITNGFSCTLDLDTTQLALVLRSARNATLALVHKTTGTGPNSATRCSLDCSILGDVGVVGDGSPLSPATYYTAAQVDAIISQLVRLNGNIGEATGVSLELSADTHASALNVKNLAVWSDSMGQALAPILGYSGGLSPYNGGVGGETSTQIRVRMLAATAKHGWCTLIWAGRNNRNAPSTVLADIAAMVAALGHDRYLILGVLNGIGEGTGSQDHTDIVAINTALAATYGDHYFEERELLVASGNPALPQDAIDMAADTVPTSLLQSIATASSITSSGTTATLTHPGSTTFTTGDYALINGAAQANYNGRFVVTVTSPTTFTYTMAGSAASPATGSVHSARVDVVHLNDTGHLLVADGVLDRLATFTGQSSAPVLTQNNLSDIQAATGNPTFLQQLFAGLPPVGSYAFTQALIAGGNAYITGNLQLGNQGNLLARLQLGGTTAAYPALKRNGTTAAFRLADETADAPISAAAGTFTGLVTSTALGFNDFAGHLRTAGVFASTGTADVVLQALQAGLGARMIQLATTNGGGYIGVQNNAGDFLFGIPANAFAIFSGTPVYIRGSSVNVVGALTTSAGATFAGTAGVVAAGGAIRVRDTNISDPLYNTLTFSASAQNEYAMGVAGAADGPAQIRVNGSTGIVTVNRPVFTPAASAAALTANGQVTMELTSNTSLTLKARGSDGTTRSVVLTLA